MSLLVDNGCGWGGKDAKVKIQGAIVHVYYENLYMEQSQTLSLMRRLSFVKQVS